MSSHIKLIWCLLALMTLSGCQIWRPSDPWQGSNIPLLQPSSFGKEVQLEQRLQWLPADSIGTPISLSITQQQIALVGLTPFGGILFSVSLNNDQASGLINEHQAVFYDGPISPGTLLQQLQWALWSSTALAQVTSASDIAIFDHPKQRLIRYNGRPVARITYTENPLQQGHILFEDLLTGQNWRVETISFQSLGPNRNQNSKKLNPLEARPQTDE